MGRKLRATLEEARKLHEVNQLRYRSEISFILKILEDIMVVPMSDVWIYPAYPEGFMGVVGGMEIDEFASQDYVYVMDVIDGLVTINRYKPAGFNPNGSLRFKSDEKVRFARDVGFEDYTFWPY
jgi:hypothetical protein